MIFEAQEVKAACPSQKLMTNLALNPGSVPLANPPNTPHHNTHLQETPDQESGGIYRQDLYSLHYFIRQGFPTLL